MEETLAVNIKIVDRSFKMAVHPGEEEFVRKAAKLINDRYAFYKEQGVNDIRDILSMVAVDTTVARLKGDDSVAQLQQTVQSSLDLLRKLMDNPSSS